MIGVKWLQDCVYSVLLHYKLDIKSRDAFSDDVVMASETLVLSFIL